MTLKELRKKVKETEEVFRPQLLKDGFYEIVAQAQLEDALLLVLRNGIVVYKTGRHMATFSLTDCGGYSYHAADGTVEDITKEQFDSMDWTIRLLLEGEKNVTGNIERSARRFETCDVFDLQGKAESAIHHDRSPVLRSEEREPWEAIVEKETFEEMISGLTESRKKLARELYWEEKTGHEVAQEQGKTYNAIKHMDYQIRKSIKEKMKKK